ncbi:MAG: cell surface protein, partial [Segetibacter sp.]|nr:cell surface protein [Segetibacter sp.]
MPSMHSESIITGRRMYLDNNVWLVMIVTSILCLGLVGYKFISKEPCTPFTLGVTGAKDDKGVYELGQPLIFRASLATDKEIVWSFGDKTELQSSTNGMVRHTFTKEGIFNVTALINGRCTGDDLRLHIKKGDLSVEKLNIKTPRILGNLNPIAGKTQTYISDVIGTDYEWKILDKTAFPTINKQSASFTFPTAGLYRLQLTVDHDRNNKRATIEINVFEDLAKVNNVSKAPPIFIPPPPKKQAPKQEPKPEQKPEIKPEIKPETPAPNAGSPSPSAPAARKIL